MKKILLIGKTGQIGSNLLQLLQGCDHRALGRGELDLTRHNHVFSQLTKLDYNPDIIIIAAAYTAVDLAESDRDICNKVNNLSVAEIARFAALAGAVLVYYSSDYVFNGSGDREFAEGDTANLLPANYYGATKLAGERAIIQSGCEYLILRTSWVYNYSGKNFVNTILRLAAQNFELRMINDQIGSPSYAPDIAAATMQMLEDIKPGIYHLVPSEQISWYRFAEMIVEQAKQLGFKLVTGKIIPITSAEYVTKARRPLNSRLSTEKLRRDYGISLPPITQSLKSCLEKIQLLNKG